MRVKQKIALLFLLLFVIPMTGYAADGDADGIELIINGKRQVYEQGITVSTPAAGKNYIIVPADGIAAALGALCSVEQNNADKRQRLRRFERRQQDCAHQRQKKRDARSCTDNGRHAVCPGRDGRSGVWLPRLSRKSRKACPHRKPHRADRTGGFR